MGIVLIIIGIFLGWCSISKNRYYEFYSGTFKSEFLKRHASLLLLITSLFTIIVGILILNGAFEYNYPFDHGDR